MDPSRILARLNQRPGTRHDNEKGGPADRMHNEDCPSKLPPRRPPARLLAKNCRFPA
jgi:hypothetical protein